MTDQKHDKQLLATGATATGPGMPAVDRTFAAIKLSEAIVGLGLTTGKAPTYAIPDLRRSLDGR